ncbi:MAG: TolC family protein [Candidatus Omnitrophica bacterium]|nr:TolC family protein [Candidatus Omnitrophota bacterium]
MDSPNSKKRLFWTFRMLCVISMTAGACFLESETALSKTSSKAQPVQVANADQTVDRINKAIEEAEKKLGANPVVEEVRKDIRTNLVPASNHSTATAVHRPQKYPKRVTGKSLENNMPGDMPVEAPIMRQPQLGFKSANTKGQANSIAWKADQTYNAQKKDYLKAHELTTQALQIDPENRIAKEMQGRINADIENRPTDLGGMTQVIEPPDGKIALAVALSDGVVTLEEAESIAVKNNLMLHSLSQRVKAARRKVNEAIRAFFPTAGLEFASGGGVISSSGYASKKAMLNFTQPVFYGGELIFTMKQAQSGLRSDEIKYDKEKADILRQLGEAYRNAVNALHNYEYQSELQETMGGITKVHEAVFKAELASEIEHLEIESIGNQVKFQVATAQTASKSSNLALCQAMGVGPDVAIPVDPDVRLTKIKDFNLEDYLKRVEIGNYDNRIRQATLEGAYYAAKVFDAQKMFRVDLRGNWGWSGEAFKQKLPDDYTTSFDGPFDVDTEHEQSLIATVSVPWGPNTTNYSYQRRFFAPTVSSFQGSEDFKHTISTNFFDRMASYTDEASAKADYLKAMAELQKEKADQNNSARQAYYDYEGALLQLETAQSKIDFRERQFQILNVTTQTEEARILELMNEHISLAEDRFSKLTAISSANNAAAKMDYLAGMEGTQTRYET